MKSYFVTGATGAIGSALIPLLLEDQETHVHLLLRAKSAQELTKRRDDLCRFWEISPDDRATQARIHVWQGDVTLPRLGLDDSAYTTLSGQCTHIVHSAGNVRMNLPIEQARHCSVDSAVSILEMARAGRRLQKIEIVSTVGVGGRTSGTVPEDWISTPRQFHNTYEQAKAEAEERIQQEVERGLPVTIHRPSMVVGNSDDGRIIHFQVFYHLCEFLSGTRTFGLMPNFGSARLDIVPANYVARTIAWSSQTNASSGRILHSSSGPTCSLLLPPLQEDVRRAFAIEGLRLPTLKRVPTGVFKALLSTVSVVMPRDVRRAIKTLPVFLDYLATDQTFANHETRALLEPTGLLLPAPETYLNKVIGYYLRSRTGRNQAGP